MLPKFIIILRGIVTHDNERFGGTAHALVSTLTEIVFSSLIAPLMLWYQSRAVLQVLFGVDGGWSAANRGGGRMSFSDAWHSSWGIVLTGIVALAFTVTAAPDMIAWLLPIAGPMIISPVLIWATSSNAEHGRLRYLFLTPTEVQAAPVMIVREQILAEWQRTGLASMLVEATATVATAQPSPAPVEA